MWIASQFPSIHIFTKSTTDPAHKRQTWICSSSSFRDRERMKIQQNVGVIEMQIPRRR